MFEHALKLVWNRRRDNRLVIVEIGAAFVVTFVLLAMAVNAWSNYQRPLGFVYEDVWRIALRPDGAVVREVAPSDYATIDDLLKALRALPRVEAAHGIQMPPFENAQRAAPLGRDADTVVLTRQNSMTAEALEALGVAVIAGRSFGPEDEGQPYRAALVNRTFVEQAFGSESPIGRRINYLPIDFRSRLPPDQAREAAREVRVAGVIEDFRQFGEFSEEAPYAILRAEPEDWLSQLFVKLASGTGRDYEERIAATVKAVAPEYGATITPWEEMRANRHRQTLVPLRAGATLAAFLLAMVALGLIGIVWQDVVRRTQEIGLRRAAGARATGVRRQILLEMMIVALFGIAIGTVIAVQIPLLELLASIDWASALPALALSAAVILLLAALAALYPAWLASRREPADALRYE